MPYQVKPYNISKVRTKHRLTENFDKYSKHVHI